MDCDTVTVDASRTLLGYYEAIAQVSRLMLEAATRQDWRSLEHAHACCEELIRTVQATGLTPDTLDAAGRRRRVEILAQIVADDKRIRELKQPSLHRFDTLLVRDRVALYERGR
ncbi:MAG: flagellar protein FliT [Pseudomonadota bacterium]|nr:flagellar protein FliT [Pseudomonadota bacterium]